MNTDTFLPYHMLLDDIKNFKQSGTSHGGDENFNAFDTPSNKYFKIMFYFGSDSEFNDNTQATGSGLLAPTWEEYNSGGDDKFYNYNSAWAYLKLNDENERAEKLEQFVTLLSDISSKSPWYFSSVGGLGDALDRKVAESGKLEMETKKLNITCLPDAYDGRIGTLLELYRDVTWSWVHKKEIIPANLRKFDMAIYIFEMPDHKVYGKDDYTPSYKMIEFHDCEFNFNSIKSAWSEINNVDGIQPKYTIDISYGDCYEISYNNIMMRTIGDVILTDMINLSKTDTVYDSKPQQDDGQYAIIKSLSNNTIPVSSLIDVVTVGDTTNSKLITTFGNLGTRSIDSARSDGTDIEYKEVYKPGFLANAVGQVAGHLVADVKSLFNRAVLGNIYTYSLTQIGAQLEEATRGNLIKTGMTVAQYIKNSESRKQENISASGNIYEGDIPATDNTGRKPIVVNKVSKQLGNIFSASTLANNL